MRPRRILAVTLAGASLAGVAHASSTDWTLETGAAVRVRPDHLGSRRGHVDVAPIVEASIGDDISISFDDGAKWRALHLGAVRMGPIVEYRQSYDEGLPAGRSRMRDAVEVGGFGEVQTPLGLADVRLRRAVDSYEGWSGDLAFSTGKPVTRRFALGGQVRLSWADSKFTRDYFGPPSHAAAPLRAPRFRADDYVTAGGELDAAQRITPRSRLILALSADHIISDLRPSPLFATRNIFTATLGLTYQWSAGPRGHMP